MIKFNKARQRFIDRGRNDIELCEEGYQGWSTKSKFYDKIEKDYFWAIPYNVLANKSVHPNRLLKEKIINIEEAKRRFKNKGKLDVVFCENDYNGWCYKSKFYDLVERDYFWSIPRDVLKNNSGHPKKTQGRRIKKLSFTFEEARQKFIEQGRTDIKLCKDGWFGWTSKKSKFYDSIQKDFFWAKASSVYNQKSSHPKRNNKKEILFKEAKERFIKQGRRDIELQEEGYKNWTTKAKFYDKNIEEYFWALPSSVYKQKSNHPEYSKEKIKKTCLEKYGVTNPLLREKTIEKTRKALIKKYGSVSPYASKDVQEKIKNIFIKKYGGHPLKDEVVKNKIKETCLKRYGAKSYIETKENRLNATNYFIKETNEPVIDWLKSQQEPKPSYTGFIQILQKINSGQKNKIKISLNLVKKIIKDYKNSKTTLEALAEQLFDTTHYNKKPHNLSEIYRPDFKLTEKVYLNVDGLYWHSEKQKENRYHFNLRKEFEDNNLRIIQFREDEIRNKPNICKSIVDNARGNTLNKVYARKCKVQAVQHKEAKTFLLENHLMGSTTARHVGLYHNNELISLLSFKEKKNICKIERFCSKIGYVITGGFCKLVSYLEKNILSSAMEEMHNWVDLRYGTGYHLLNKGFAKKRDTLGWKWTDGHSTFNRLKCRANMDDRKLTQQQHADELGWYKIYDAGQRVYVKKLN